MGACPAILLSARLLVLHGFQASFALWWFARQDAPQSYRFRLKGTWSDVHVSPTSSLQDPTSVISHPSACPRASPQSRFGDEVPVLPQIKSLRRYGQATSS